MTTQHVLSREQVRALDHLAVERFGIPSILLMENAGRGCAELLIEQGVAVTSPVCICCGKGTNGGDGFVMARHLEIRGVPVEVLIFHDPQEDSGDAATNFRILRRSDVPIHQLSLPADRVQLEKHLQRASWVVDALLGTGARGPARFPYDLIIDRINAAGRPVFAIDLPSGLDCDLGDPAAHCVRATLTATLVAAKPGFLAPAGKAHVGEVHVLDIGVPRTVLAALHGGADEEAEPETG